MLIVTLDLENKPGPVDASVSVCAFLVAIFCSLFDSILQPNFVIILILSY